MRFHRNLKIDIKCQILKPTDSNEYYFKHKIGKPFRKCDRNHYLKRFLRDKMKKLS